MKCPKTVRTVNLRSRRDSAKAFAAPHARRFRHRQPSQVHRFSQEFSRFLCSAEFRAGPLLSSPVFFQNLPHRRAAPLLAAPSFVLLSCIFGHFFCGLMLASLVVCCFLLFVLHLLPLLRFTVVCGVAFFLLLLLSLVALAAAFAALLFLLLYLLCCFCCCGCFQDTKRPLRPRLLGFVSLLLLFLLFVAAFVCAAVFFLFVLLFLLFADFCCFCGCFFGSPTVETPPLPILTFQNVKNNFSIDETRKCQEQFFVSRKNILYPTQRLLYP